MKDQNNTSNVKVQAITRANCPDCWGYSEYNNEIRSRSFLDSKSKIGWIAQYAIDKLGINRCSTNIDC